MEERVGTSTTADITYTWGLRYVDDLICRDRSISATETERLYSLPDPNWNVVTLTNTSGVIQERYNYSAFGKANVFSGSFAARTASSYGWTRTFTGQVFDDETGLMLYRNRFYHVTLGRFVSPDPIGYQTYNTNMYRYVISNPIRYVDILGLQQTCTVGDRFGYASDTSMVLGKNEPGKNATMLNLATLFTLLGSIPTNGKELIFTVLNPLPSNAEVAALLAEHSINEKLVTALTGGMLTVWSKLECFECKDPNSFLRFCGYTDPYWKSLGKAKWKQCDVGKTEWGKKNKKLQPIDPAFGLNIKLLKMDDVETIKSECEKQIKASC